MKTLVLGKRNCKSFINNTLDDQLNLREAEEAVAFIQQKNLQMLAKMVFGTRPARNPEPSASSQWGMRIPEKEHGSLKNG